MQMDKRLALLVIPFLTFLASCRDQSNETYPSLSGTFREKWAFTSNPTVISNGCASGDRGTVYVTEDNRLMVVYQGVSYPYFIVPLDADGGANKTVGNYTYPTRPIRVTVAPGTKPRTITSLNEMSLCGYRFDSD